MDTTASSCRNSTLDTDSMCDSMTNETTMVLLEGLKLFIKQHARYVSERNDTNLISLQKELDVIYDYSSSACELNNDSQYLIVTDAMSSLITLLTDPDIKRTIADKTVSIFMKWVSSPYLHWLLKATFQLTSTLSTFLVHHDEGTGNEPIILMCLDLLRVLTYDVRICKEEVSVDDLLKFLLTHVLDESPTGERALPCMVVLANICRRNSLVQKKIRNMNGAKYFYRSIVNKIFCPSNGLFTVAALSIFTSVAIDEEVGSKFFQSKDVIRTVQLLLHKATNEDLEIQCFALDTLIDLLSKEKIQRILLQYEYFNDCLMKTIRLVNTESSSRTVCKVYELLSFVESQRILKQSVVKALHEAESSGIGDRPIVVALHWLAHPPQKLWNPSVWAANFILQLFKSSTGSTTSALHDHLEEILPTVSGTFVQCYSAHKLYLDVHLEKMLACLKLVLLLCEVKNYASKVVQSIASDVFFEMIDFLAGNFETTNYGNHGSTDYDGQIVDAMLHFLLIMNEAKSSTNDIQDHLYSHLQDPKLMPMFAHALTSSDSQERISQAFHLLALGSKLSDFPKTSLADALLKANRLHDRQQCQLKDQSTRSLRVTDDANRMVGVSVSEGEVRSVHEAQHNIDDISNLLTRFKNSLDIKDIKSSEIMEIYEHKIHSLEMKEKHLQGLLDAKAVALQHADRILVEYRSRWARSDGEALQLRGILKESESRGEVAKEEVTNAHREIHQRQRDLVSVTEMNNELDLKNKDLKKNCVGLNNKIQDLHRTVQGMSEEIHALSEANAAVIRSRDNFEEKMKELETLVTTLETDKLSNVNAIKERDSRIKDLKKFGLELEVEMHKSAQSNSKLAKEKETLQTEIDGVKVQLAKKETEYLVLQADLEKCQAELSQHKALIAVIQNMAGNIAGNVSV